MIHIVDIKVPKTRDRGGQGIHFRSELLPRYIKRTKSAEKGWRKLRGFRRLADVINGVKFIDGIDEETFKRQG